MGGAGESRRRESGSSVQVGPDAQLALFAGAHPVVEQLRSIDVNNMTPLQALEQLARLIEEAQRS
jgi:hypothetical protein